MIIVKTKLKNGVLEPVSKLPECVYGKMFNGSDWLIFESQKEADENVPKNETVEQKGTAIQALLNATPEEIELIKNLLK